MQISILPMMGLLAKLADPDTGFNQAYAAACATYGISNDLVIKFPASIFAKPTNNFFMGNLSDQMIADSVSKKSWMRLFVDGSKNDNYEKPRSFSGIVKLNLDVNLCWLSGNALQTNFAIFGMAVEDAVAQVVQIWQGQSVGWGGGVVFNGEFTCQQGAIQKVGQGELEQIVSITLVFQVDVGSGF